MKSKCLHIESEVKDSRPTVMHGFPTVQRRRLCHSCGQRFTTYDLTANGIMAVRLDGLQKKIVDKAIGALQESMSDALLAASSDLTALADQEEKIAARSMSNSTSKHGVSLT